MPERTRRSGCPYTTIRRYPLCAAHASRHTAIVEFNTRSRQLGLSGLYSFTPRPNTAVYLGYSDLLTDDGVAANGHARDGFGRLQRTLFVKVGFGWRVE